MVAFIMVLQIQDMDVQCQIGDLDFDGEAELRKYHEKHLPEKQLAAGSMCAQIRCDYRQQNKTESKSRDRLDDAYQPQAFAKSI